VCSGAHASFCDQGPASDGDEVGGLLACWEVMQRAATPSGACTKSRRCRWEGCEVVFGLCDMKGFLVSCWWCLFCELCFSGEVDVVGGGGKSVQTRTVHRGR
jgi:hypothetical protein